MHFPELARWFLTELGVGLRRLETIVAHLEALDRQIRRIDRRDEDDITHAGLPH